MKFSQRMGFSPNLIEIDENAMPDSLRNGLWDACSAHFFNNIEGDSPYQDKSEEFDFLCMIIWFNYFKEPADGIPDFAENALSYVRKSFFIAKYWEIYDFIEFLAQINEKFGASGTYFKCKEFAEFCNKILAREKAAFRFASCQLIKVTSEFERQEIEAAKNQDISVGVREHLSLAAEHYSRRDTPDYRNSIKESISTVEAAVSHIVGKKSSGVKPLQTVSEKLGLHPALAKGFNELYGYTSDAGGIRHALMDKPDIAQEDAHYMLVSCAAFANYLLKLKSKG